MIKVGIQGELGSFSHEAGTLFFPENNVDYVNCFTFQGIFDGLEKNDIEYGILPIENSTYGIIVENYDLFSDSLNYSKGEVLLPVHFYLLANSGGSISSIKKAYTHKVSIPQVSVFTKEAAISVEAFSDNGSAAKYVRDSNKIDVAAICSKSCSLLYGLDVIAGPIENNKNNFTRFLLITKNELSPEVGSRPILINRLMMSFDIKNETGSLLELLTVFSKNNISLSMIHSRPKNQTKFEYHFYIEAEVKSDFTLTNVREMFEEKYNPQIISLLPIFS